MEMENTKCDNFWGDPPGTSNSSHGHGSHSHSQHLQYERNLNFSTVTIEDNEYGFPRKKTVRDPMSHRIIEKRRRDRMNNCLADLARLLPPDSLRKGRGRIEKTEIVELAIKHLRHLQTHPCPDSDNCEYNQIPLPRASSSSHGKSTVSNGGGGSSSSSNSSGSASGEVDGSGSADLGGGGGEGGSGKISDHPSSSAKINPEEQYRLGFQESVSETMHFLVEHEGMYAGDDLCVRLVQHLNGHCEALLMDHVGNNTKIALGFPMNSRSLVFKGRKSGGSLDSISSGYQPNGSSGSGSDGNCVNDGDRDGINNTPFGSKNVFSRQPGQSLTSQSLRVSNSSSGGDRDRNSLFVDYEGDQNSCSSAPLSIEISDAYSQDIDGKMTGRSQGKPPVPTIICSHSSSNNSGSPPVSNSDEGSSMTTNSSTSTNTAHRYKFKNNIKQRFSADLQTEIIVRSHNNRTGDESVTSGSGRDSSQESRHRNPQKSCLNSPRDSSRENESPDYFPKSPDSEKNPTSSSSSSHETSKERNQNQPEETEQSSGLTIISQAANPASTNVIAATRAKANAPLLTHEEGRTEFEIPSIPSPSLEVDKKPIVSDLLPAHVTLPIITTVASSLKGEGGGKPTTVTCGPQGVPAFALHDKGLYYIPLTIDKSIVSPFIDAMDGSSTPPLHPVTISVCFVLPPEDGASGHKKYEAHESSKNLSSLSIPIPLPMPHSPPVFGALHHPPSGKIHREFSSSPSNFIMNRFTQSQGPNMIFRSPTSGGGASVVKSNNSGSFRGHGGYPISGGSECSSQSSSNLGQIHHHQHQHHSDPTAVHNLYHHAGRNGDGGGSRSGNVEFHSSNYYTNSNSGSNAHRSSGSSSSMSVSSSSMSVSHHGAGGASSESSSASGSASVSRNRLSRKRSISKSPSISIGYHSWSEKTGGSNETCSAYSADEGVITGHRSRGDHSGDRDVGSTSSASPSHSGPVPMGVGPLASRGIPMPVPMTLSNPMEPHSHGHGHGHGDALHSLPVRHHSNMNTAPNSMKSVAASAQIQIPVLYPELHHHHPQQQHQHHQSLTTSSLMEHEERQHQQHLSAVSSRRESKSRVDNFPPSSSSASAKRSKKSRMDEGIAGVTHKSNNGGYASSRKHVSSN